MKILGIETSSKTASVAVADENGILGEFSYSAKKTHSQVILPLALELLEKLELTIKDMDCVAVSDGPGSYTGLRIGIAAAKGLTFSGEIKCCGVSSLMALAYELAAFEGTVAAAVRARAGVVYFGAYSFENGRPVCVLQDRVCTDEQLEELIAGLDGKVMLTGDICQEVKEKLFPNSENISAAPLYLRELRASSLCAIAAAMKDNWTDGEQLNARYLQETKAEKDKRFSENARTENI